MNLGLKTPPAVARWARVQVPRRASPRNLPRSLSGKHGMEEMRPPAQTRSVGALSASLFEIGAGSSGRELLWPDLEGGAKGQPNALNSIDPLSSMQSDDRLDSCFLCAVFCAGRSGRLRQLCPSGSPRLRPTGMSWPGLHVDTGILGVGR